MDWKFLLLFLTIAYIAYNLYLKIIKHYRYEVRLKDKASFFDRIFVSLVKSIIIIPLFIVPNELRKYVWRSLGGFIVLIGLILVFGMLH